MGSRMPDLQLIPRMDEILHPFLQTTTRKKTNKTTSQHFSRKQMDVSQKNTKTKMTALARSIDLKHPRTIL